MRRQFFAGFVIFLFLVVGALAHGDKKHVLGTIEKLDSGSVTVKTRDGKLVEVKLVGSTVYVSRVGTVDKAGEVC